jgi:hypothetical protein
MLIDDELDYKGIWRDRETCGSWWVRRDGVDRRRLRQRRLFRREMEDTATRMALANSEVSSRRKLSRSVTPLSSSFTMVVRRSATHSNTEGHTRVAGRGQV